jgi:hypothetical protein
MAVLWIVDSFLFEVFFCVMTYILFNYIIWIVFRKKYSTQVNSTTPQKSKKQNSNTRNYKYNPNGNLYLYYTRILTK